MEGQLTSFNNTGFRGPPTNLLKDKFTFHELLIQKICRIKFKISLNNFVDQYRAIRSIKKSYSKKTEIFGNFEKNIFCQSDHNFFSKIFFQK